MLDNKFKVQFIVNAPNCKPAIFISMLLYILFSRIRSWFARADSMGCAPLTVNFIIIRQVLLQTILFGILAMELPTPKRPTHTFATIDSVYNVNLSITNNVSRQ